MPKRPELIQYPVMVFRPLYPDRCDPGLLVIANERNAAANEDDFDFDDPDDFDFG